MKKNDVFFIVAGVIVIGVIYFVFKPKKSFLKMTEAEKKASVEKEAEKIFAIQNDKSLTEEQKVKIIEAMNRKNLETRTKEEQKAIADYNVKNLISGNIKLKLNSFDMGVMPNIF